MEDKQLKRRCHLFYVLIVVLVIVAVGRLFYLQVVEGENYRTVSDSRLARNIPIKAPRGDILDRYGRPLVTNRVGHTVSISKVNDNKAALNHVILSIANLFRERGISYEDTLPISESAPYSFIFAGETVDQKNASAQAFFKEKDYQDSITAGEVIEKYIKKYDISASYSPEEVRVIAGIRYEMEKRNFSSNNPYVFAKDVDIETVTKIKEQRDTYYCVNVYSEPIREYVNGTLAAHILGRVGIINQEEYAELKDQGYGMNDYLGKQGVEKAFESYLRGKDGASSVERKIKEGESEVVYSVEPIPGDSVMLTIDRDLQRVAEESLATNIQRIAATSDYGNGHDANAGAVVAIDLNSGEILALASYPTYNLASFNKDFNTLNSNPARPMVNRALTGTYEPGSTFKLCTALAALESGKVTPAELIETKGIYKYLDHDFMCHIYRSAGGNHGTINVSQAIQHSCNYFFYEMASRMGYEPIESYARQFGLGALTGQELSFEEEAGQIAGPALREKNGREWYPGDVLQMAIGQSDNLFTPIQMANYMATLANGGTNYETRLLKAVKSNTTDRIILENTPKIRNQITIAPKNLDAVLAGMQLATSEGTASAAFADFPFTTGGKTGSAQVSKGSSNGIYVGYAPYDNPQIAIAVVVEHGGSGGNAAYIARDVFWEYFFGAGSSMRQAEQYNVLLP